MKTMNVIYFCDYRTKNTDRVFLCKNSVLCKKISLKLHWTFKNFKQKIQFKVHRIGKNLIYTGLDCPSMPQHKLALNMRSFRSAKDCHIFSFVSGVTCKLSSPI